MTLLAVVLGASLGALSSSPASVPISEGFVTVEPGVRLYYRKVGEGKNVFVSPMGSWLAEPLAPLARVDRTLILYDTRGRGRSNRVDASKVSFANEISDLDALRRHFGLETMMLAGWSHYGMMTAVYAIRNPGRVTRLLQITPGAPRSDPYLQEGMAALRARADGARYEAVQAKRKAGGFEKDPAGLCRALQEATRPAFFSNPSDAAKMTFDGCALETEWPDNQDPWWNALFSSMTPWDYRKEAQALPVPRLVVQGEKDFIPLEGSREWVAGNPNARLLVMKGVGHHPFVEDPTAFLAAVEPFLEGKWPAGAEAVPASEAPKSVAVLAREARAAYDRGDRETFRRNYEEIARRRPGDVFVLYNLACGQSLTGQSEAAQATLGEIARRRAWVDMAADEDFAPIRETEGYRKAAASLAALRTERVSGGATRAFAIPEKGLVPEGVAYDPVSKSFFVSSIRRREVFRVSADGRISQFVSPARDGLRSAMGLGVDPKRRTLWVASQALPSMDRFAEGQALSSAVFEYDLDTGRLRKEHRPPEAGEAPGFDDLTVAPDGRVFVNDGRNPRVWTIPPGGALEVFFEDDGGAMGGTQGLAVSPDGKTLYASDYRGLFAIDMSARRVTRLTAPDDLALNGIDGLVYANGGLIAIQNGIQPNRVIRLDLNPDGLGISRGRILEMSHPDFDEPTLGTVVGDALYFTADSQGQKFLDEKKPMPASEMRDAVILKLPLR
jgi:pimeloyl-ACP methyl ester carboxylesterase/sugar lactone lactonase YvrE